MLTTDMCLTLHRVSSFGQVQTPMDHLEFSVFLHTCALSATFVRLLHWRNCYSRFSDCESEIETLAFTAFGVLWKQSLYPTS
jgi:hypothetical protein